LEGLETKLKEREEDIKSGAKAASSTAYSLSQQYSLVDIAKLVELVEIVQCGCKHCGKRLFLSSQSLIGHGLELALQCGNCARSVEWIGSHQYPDGSFQVNRDVV
jgi:hypothetical protein